jgi:hypothetical protein
MPSFYLDHDVAQNIAPALRTHGYTATTAREQKLEYAPDDEHLLFAAIQGWVFITCNTTDYVLLHRAWQRWGTAWKVNPTHAGILAITQSWKPNQAADEIKVFIDSGRPLLTQMYVWTPSKTWRPEPPP